MGRFPGGVLTPDHPELAQLADSWQTTVPFGVQFISAVRLIAPLICDQGGLCQSNTECLIGVDGNVAVTFKLL